MTFPITFHFDERKAAQAAAWLLRRHGRPLDAARLATLLYLVDRRAVLESGGPTTGDAWIATEHGPSLRRIAELHVNDIAIQAEAVRSFEALAAG